MHDFITFFFFLFFTSCEFALQSSEGVMVLENLPVLDSSDAGDYFVSVGSAGKTVNCIRKQAQTSLKREAC